jgi:hypothetical protein
MGTMAAIIGVIGTICAIIGILDAAKIIPSDLGLATMDWSFWLGLASTLFLGTIALLVGRGPGKE